MNSDTIAPKMADHFESIGRSRLEGSVFGHLMIVDPPYRDLPQLQTELQVDRDQLSVALNRLLASGLICLHPVTGNSRNCFKIDIQGWLDRTKKELRKTRPFLELIKQVASTNDTEAPSPFSEELKLAIRFHKELDEFLESFLQRWEFNHEYFQRQQSRKST